jgi:hypothetical protein
MGRLNAFREEPAHLLCIRSIIDMHEAMGLLHGGWWTNVIPYRP